MLKAFQLGYLPSTCRLVECFYTTPDPTAFSCRDLNTGPQTLIITAVRSSTMVPSKEVQGGRLEASLMIGVVGNLASLYEVYQQLCFDLL